MSQQARPLVSVLMPIYNCMPFLDDAIQSVQHQTLTNFECILVNDGSKDESLHTMRQHASEDPRLRVIDKPNGGIVSALNAGLAECRGEFITRMDGDDLCVPDRFERQVAFLQQHPEIGIVGGWAEVIDENDRLAESCTCKAKDPAASCWCSVIRLPPHHAEIDDGLSKGSYTMLHPTIMIRASVMDKLQGYDPEFRIAEDLDLLLRAGEITHLANLQQIVLRYRRRASSQTKSWAAETPKWNAKALLAARTRGRIVTAATFASMAEQMSWKKADQGQYRSALEYAAQSLQTAPASKMGYRAFTRVFWRMLRGTVGPREPVR